MKSFTPILEVKGLRFKRQQAVPIDIPHLIVYEKEVLALIGPNGAGKTTLMEVLAHLVRPQEGQIIFEGKEIDFDRDQTRYRRKLAMVFQEPLLLDTTVFENVASGLKFRGLKKKEIDQKVEHCLERFGIAHLRHRPARLLSGGEAQRTSLARAFAVEPRILLLDEPFSSLDPPSRESLIEDLEANVRGSETTAILATHDRTEALRLSDRIAVMMEGRIRQIGPSDEIMNHPVNEEVASFVGVETILSCKVLSRNGGSFVASFRGQEIEAVGDAQPGEVVLLCIRPEEVTLSTGLVKESTSARNVFPGRVTNLRPLGLYQKVELDCGFPLTAYVTHHSAENLLLEEGKEIWASFKATAIHVIRKKG